tara:strand:+ start:2701 stop:3405 length:705 start_codon:yes stop_codon:yes gene_type:complete
MIEDLENYFNCKIEIIFSKKRKTVSIQVNPHGIKVRSSYWLTKYEIKQFLLKNELWIKQKVNEQKSKVKTKLDLIDNQEMLLGGKRFILKVTSDIIPKPKIENNHLYLSNHPDIVKSFGTPRKQIQIIVKEYAYNLLLEKTKSFSLIMSVNPISIKIKDYRSRWGSCSFKGDISYNWKIIFAPIEVIEYLIIHELSHLIFFNHSKEFWLKVEEFQPNFKNYRKWLKNNSYKLDI